MLIKLKLRCEIDGLSWEEEGFGGTWAEAAKNAVKAYKAQHQAECEILAADYGSLDAIIVSLHDEVSIRRRLPNWMKRFDEGVTLTEVVCYI
jgi:hypothetical protein